MKSKSILDSYSLFIFDWDGTLCTMGSLLRANEWAKRRLKTWNRASRIKEIESNKKELKTALEVDETKNEIMASVFEVLTIFYRPRLHRNVVELLELLKKEGKRVAILSNGNGRRIIRELDKSGIRKYFDLVVSAKDIGAVKPDPRGIRAIMRKLGKRAEQTLYIGDMVDDMLTADMAKVDSCALSCGFDSHAKLASTRPTHIFPSVEEMYLLIGKKGKTSR